MQVMLPSLSLPADIESLHESHSLRKQSVSIIGPKYCPKYYPHHGGPFQVHETITEAMYNRALSASPLPPSLPSPQNSTHAFSCSPDFSYPLVLFIFCLSPSHPQLPPFPALQLLVRHTKCICCIQTDTQNTFFFLRNEAHSDSISMKFNYIVR